MHSCDTPSCVNPAHLSLGTPSDNMRDMIEKKRHLTKIGNNHYRARLTEKDVLEMRALRIKGTLIRELAAMFNVGRSTVNHIIKRDSWKHI